MILTTPESWPRRTSTGGWDPFDSSLSTTSCMGTSTERRRRQRRRLLRRYLGRVILATTLFLTSLYGDRLRIPETPSLQVLGPYLRQMDHTGIPAWTIPMSWQDVEILIYTGTERGAAIIEAVLRQAAYSSGETTDAAVDY